MLCTIFFFLLTGCKNKEELPGISDEPLSQEDILGGWASGELTCQFNHESSLAMAIASKQVKNNLERRFQKANLYINADSIYFIEKHQEGYYYVKSASPYLLVNDPARIEIDHNYLICDQYAPYYLIKITDGKLCLYLTKEQVISMMEKNEEVNEYIDAMKDKIEEAQLEFFFTPSDLTTETQNIIANIEEGDYIHSDNYNVY